MNKFRLKIIFINFGLFSGANQHHNFAAGGRLGVKCAEALNWPALNVFKLLGKFAADRHGTCRTARRFDIAKKRGQPFGGFI